MATMWFFLSVSSVLIVCAIGQELSLPRVNITQGTVVGSVAVNETHFEFYGIPYADSTAGTNRFKVHFCNYIFKN